MIACSRACYQRNWYPARRWPWAALSVAASFALIAVVFAFWKTPAETHAFETAVGENRSVALADGSIISLGGDTRIEVALSENIRAIEPNRLIITGTVERENISGWVQEPGTRL